MWEVLIMAGPLIPGIEKLVMKNPQPRFAYDEEQDWIFDYVTSKSLPCEGIVELPDGKWDLAKVKELILAGKSIETAYLGAANNVEQAGADFIKQMNEANGWGGQEPIPPESEEFNHEYEEPKGE